MSSRAGATPQLPLFFLFYLPLEERADRDRGCAFLAQGRLLAANLFAASPEEEPRARRGAFEMSPTAVAVVTRHRGYFPSRSRFGLTVAGRVRSRHRWGLYRSSPRQAHNVLCGKPAENPEPLGRELALARRAVIAGGRPRIRLQSCRLLPLSR